MSRDALVIGINTYSDASLPDLTAPSADAEAIAQILERDGEFRVTRLPAVKDKQNPAVKVGKKTQVSLAQLKKAIVQLFKPNGKPPDTALLYFSGHGLRDDLGVPEGFLATSDTNSDAGNWGLSLRWLREVLQASDVRQQIVILDCCHAGEVLNVGDADPGDRGKGRDRCFIAASRTFEEAFQAIGSPHSVLTAALLAGLEPQAERWVTNYTLIDFLNQYPHNFPQRPIFANSGEPINLTRRWTVADTPKPASVDAICPYKGLEYFDCTAADARFFYGRTALTDQLLEKVRSGNFLAVLGASGSGKSSVVRAGLLYQLMLGRRLSGSEAWQVRIFRPGERPLQNLALAFVDPSPTPPRYGEGLMSSGEEEEHSSSPCPRREGGWGVRSNIDRATQFAQAEELLKRGADGLRQLVQAADTPRVVLVADQFEEAFTLCRDVAERERFFACLLGALAQVGDKLCLVVAMRADFFGKCAEREYGGLAQAIQANLVTVTPMTREGIRQAIVEPAKQVGVAVEPELVERAIEDVEGSPGSLPLLQYALRELWQLRLPSPPNPLSQVWERGNPNSEGNRNSEGTPNPTNLPLTPLLPDWEKGLGDEGDSPGRTEGNLLTVAAYTRLGGVKGTLEKRATEVYEALSEEERQVAKRVFLELTQLGEGTEDTRRQVVLGDLATAGQSAAEIEAVVQKLADAKLVVTSATTVGAGVDPPKSPLIRGTLNPVPPFSRGARGDLAVVDVAHEALIRHWKLLRQWLEENREVLRQKRKIEMAAAEWRERKKAKDYLLQGRRLREAKEFCIEPTNGLVLSSDVEHFIDRSIRQQRVNVLKLVGGVLVLPLIGTVLIAREINLASHRKAIDDCVGKEYCSGRRQGLEALSRAGKSLRRLNLAGANLEEIDLGGADLGGANLEGANLEGANLGGADLGGANLGGANLEGANLGGANLGGAKLGEADLRDADLGEADLRDADLGEADLWRANLEGANLEGANLWRAHFAAPKPFIFVFNRSGGFAKAQNLTPAQVKSACYWEEAKFDPEFQAKLDKFPDPETKVDCLEWKLFL